MSSGVAGRANSITFEDLLIQRQILTPDLLAAAQKRALAKGVPIEELLLSEKRISEVALAEIHAAECGLEFIADNNVHPTPEAAQCMPARLSKRQGILPLTLKDDVLTLAIRGPAALLAIDRLRQENKFKLVVKIATHSAIERGLEKAYASAAEIAAAAASATNAVPDKKGDRAKVQFADGDDVSMEILVNQIIREAIKQKASDIHVEPEEEFVRVRARIDGQLHELTTLKSSTHSPLVSRLKVLAQLDIAEKRNAQDGSFQHNEDGRHIDLRVSTLPTVKGEKVVLRILDKSSLKIDLEQLGITGDLGRDLKHSLESPHGIVLVAGPTGSGKTTTVYSMLNHVNSIGKNIVTIEDPVEFRFGLINQVQINARAGLTFASVLRNILRQDPDIIMVGEIRDNETAGLATRAALTGHLVISTIHTNDALSTVFRLADMGIEPYLLGSALQAVISQRLVKLLCRHCKKPGVLNDEDRRRLGEHLIPAQHPVWEPVGCERCHGNGYSGRQPIFEILCLDAELQRFVSEMKPLDAYLPVLKARNFRTIRMHGIEKLKEGLTSVKEVLKVTL